MVPAIKPRRSGCEIRPSFFLFSLRDLVEMQADLEMIFI